MAQLMTITRVKAAALSAELREELRLSPEEEVNLTVEPVTAPPAGMAGWLEESFGSWQGPETPEELIALIYSARRRQRREVDLESP